MQNVPLTARLLQKASFALRYFLPSQAERAYERAVARAEAFDAEYYVQVNPRLNRLFRYNPLRHYVQHGEAKGLSPNGWFSPRAYLYHNRDLDPETTQPLLHYLETGQHEKRTIWLARHEQELPRFAAAPAALAAPAPVAVVLHLHYLDMWEEFAAALAPQTFAFDLWVTLCGQEAVQAHTVRARILHTYPAAQVHIVPNHGRDIFPFVWLVNSGALAPYAAVCKLHSKKSPHRADGAQWRKALIAGVLATPDVTHTRLTRFLADPRMGFWVAQDQRYEGDVHWGINHAPAIALLAARGITLPEAPLVFPAGSIYWVRGAVVAALADLALEAAEFEPEQAMVDGTTAHVIERVMGVLAQREGLEICTPQMLDPTPR